MTGKVNLALHSPKWNAEHDVGVLVVREQVPKALVARLNQ